LRDSAVRPVRPGNAYHFTDHLDSPRLKLLTASATWIADNLDHLGLSGRHALQDALLPTPVAVAITPGSGHDRVADRAVNRQSANVGSWDIASIAKRRLRLVSHAARCLGHRGSPADGFDGFVSGLQRAITL
jgi:hypothetical protein